MADEEELGTVALRLSTGYEVEIDLDTTSTAAWRGHLARAIFGERVLAEVKDPKDRPAGEVAYDAIPEEILYLLATMPEALKDALLFRIFFEDVLRLA